MHPALQRGLIPMRDAIDSDGTMWPTETVGRPKICTSHTCVDWIILPSDKLIVRGAVAMRLLATSAPSMMNIDVALVSAIAWFAAIAMVLRYCSIGLPNIALGIAANDGTINFCIHFVLEQFEITTMAVSFSTQAAMVAMVGSRELGVAETKFLHLCATPNISAQTPPVVPCCRQHRLVHTLSARVVPCCNKLLSILARVPYLVVCLSKWACL